jgi:NADPH2:quinone reductase
MVRLAAPGESTMKAAYFDGIGTPDVIRYGEVPSPEPKAGEVLVRVAAACVNPLDVYIRAGLVKMPTPFPFVPGADLAGTVESVGPDCKRFKVGDRVWGSNQGMLGRQGTFAEFSAVNEEFLYELPKGVPEQTAASLALVGITAHLGLFWRGGIRAGDSVFVNGGTGGVGLCVIQMAKKAGAKVVATVGSAAKADLAREFGADTTVNYKTDDVVHAVKEATGGKGVDVFYETQPPTDFAPAVEMTAPRGRIIVMAGRNAKPVLPNGAFYVKGLQLLGFAMFNCTPDEQRACANDMNRWMAEGTLRPHIGRVFPFSEAAKAHQLQEENTLGKSGTLSGKIVLVPG